MRVNIINKHYSRSNPTFSLMIGLFLMNLSGASAFTPGNPVTDSQELLSINTNDITLSGLSSGSYMATQFHLSHAEIVDGVGIIAAGPYNCARGSIARVFAECVNKAPASYDKSLFSPFTGAQAASIADPEFLQSDKVWMLHGTLDDRIHADVAAGLFEQYQQWLPASNIIFINNKPFSHVFPTEGLGGKCEMSQAPFIGNCDYDAAGKMLMHLVGNLKPKVEQKVVSSAGALVRFDQARLAGLSASFSDYGMAKEGFIYLPNSCKSGNTCDVHISFHGCNQSISSVNDAYARNTGINQWASNNDLIVLYPQVEKSTMMPMNPQACWDWWGYTDANYANREGKQIQAVHNMLNNISRYLGAISPQN